MYVWPIGRGRILALSDFLVLPRRTAIMLLVPFLPAPIQVMLILFHLPLLLPLPLPDGSLTDEISARAIIQAKYRVCGGPLQTRNDTKYRTEALYTRRVAM